MEKQDSFQKSEASSAPKMRSFRKPVAHTAEQLRQLEEAFQEDQYPDFEKRLALARQLETEYRRIQLWFINRRAKEKQQQQLENPSSPTHSDLEVSSTPHRKVRKVYSQEELRQLEEVFQKNKYPDPEECLALASRLDIKCKQVQVWFQNHRHKERQQRRVQNPDSPAHSGDVSA